MRALSTETEKRLKLLFFVLNKTQKDVFILKGERAIAFFRII